MGRGRLHLPVGIDRRRRSRLVAGVLAFIAWLFQSLWNLTIADIFHGPTLTFWQAAGLWMLIGMIGGLFRSNGKKKE